MFEIEYKGANCVIISTKKSKLVIDPKLSIVGLRDVPCKDAIEVSTEERFALNSPEAKLVIGWPGEYGIADYDIRGIPVRRHIDNEAEGLVSTMYRIEIGDTRLGVIGNVHNKLSDEQLEELGVIDILIIPVGGNGYTLDAVDAAKMVRTIDPKIVIPVHYADKSIRYEVPQDELASFVTELAVPVETVSKFKFKQLPVAPSGMQLIEITRTS